MKTILYISILLLSILPLKARPIEGSIDTTFVHESVMQRDLLQMLAGFSAWMSADFLPEGYFAGENSGASDERGVRTNADLSMICAFLVKYAPGNVTLPPGVTFAMLDSMAIRSLDYALSTHKANRITPCTDGRYWGSTGIDDSVWESSLWAMSVAYSAFFQWDSLSAHQKQMLKSLLTAECDYELQRNIPTAFRGDTKAEENGWEADVLAVTLGLYPDDERAPLWFNRLREFAINSYSHPDDAFDHTVIDPHYDSKTVADLFLGPNLFPDYTLQNHDLFHTSYQNVVMQELGEAALALKLFQTTLHGHEKWHTSALMHNTSEVMTRVLNRLALADGELAMPNGNDWSLFLFDQITSYSTMACFVRDPDALMLENLAFKFIRARQLTTPDGSWLLNPDVGARRMGVQAHRVMMTWLMHHILPTSSITPSLWADFRSRNGRAYLFPDQNIVTASTPHRFTCFSWSKGLKSYTGYFTQNSPGNNKMVVPFRANNTGNLLGWYEVEGRKTDAIPVVDSICRLSGESFVINGELNTNQSTLNNRFALYSTPGNALIYIDHITANSDLVITRELGGLLAISLDPFTTTSRTLYAANGIARQCQGHDSVEIPTPWVNIDGQIGIVTPRKANHIRFADHSLNNSIYTSKLYPLYSSTPRRYHSGDTVDRRALVYYCNVDSATTSSLSAAVIPIAQSLPSGWNGLIAADPDSTRYLLLANFSGPDNAELQGITTPYGSPVFSIITTITPHGSNASFTLTHNHSHAEPLNIFIKSNDPSIKGSGKHKDLLAVKDSTGGFILHNPNHSPLKCEVTILTPSAPLHRTLRIKAGATLRLTPSASSILVTSIPTPLDFR